MSGHRTLPEGDRRLRAVLEYDGSGYAGFQRQPDQETVQGSVDNLLSQLCGHPVVTVGAGRTDAGVHALGQVIHFDTSGRIPAGRIQLAFNSRSGPSLVIRAVEETDAGFHARFSAVSRTYRYLVTRDWPNPFEARVSVREARLLPDAADRMQAAVDGIVGLRDFAAFASAQARGGSTRRTLLRSVVTEDGGNLSVELTADAFLHNMVRIIVGQLLLIGRGEAAPEALSASLERGERVPGTVTAPARGLTLTSVAYPDGYPTQKF